MKDNEELLDEVRDGLRLITLKLIELRRPSLDDPDYAEKNKELDKQVLELFER